MTTKISNNENAESGLLPYPVIIAATKGDPEAMNIVVQHYESYIASLSMRKLRDERGNTYWGICAAVSVTRMSSTRTCRTAASTTRLSMAGSATPCCHLYMACGVAKSKISCRSLTDRPACFRSLLIFCPVPVISMVGRFTMSFTSCYQNQYPGGHAPYGVLWSGGPRLARTGTKWRPLTHGHSMKSRVLSHLS